MWRLIFLCFIFLSNIQLTAQTSPQSSLTLTVDTDSYPAYSLVRNTPLPVVDRVDLARRLHGIQTTVIHDTASEMRLQGDIETFRINSVIGGGTADIQAELVTISDHIYLWVEQSIAYDDDWIESMVRRLDAEAYRSVSDLWGDEDQPGVDGESRLHVVVTQRLRRGLGGYFSSINSYPAAIISNSNEKDMIVLGTNILLEGYADTVISTTAHEFFHLIHHQRDANESGWLNEGLATFTEHLLAVSPPTYMPDAFMTAPQTSLTQRGLSSNSHAEYGAAMLFIAYLFDRFGMNTIQDILNAPDNGLASIDRILGEQSEPSVDIVFADWVLANHLQIDGTDYGYRSIEALAEPQQGTQSVPATLDAALAQYATHYYRFDDVSASVTVSLQMNQIAPLINTYANSGEVVWYSQRGDLSNPRLTRQFDLREITEAHLDYSIWYDLETEWDYGYVSVSIDGGATWAIQATQYTTDRDSNGRSYGPGYTGQSRTWLRDRLDLNQFAGQEVLVRFEMVTDDSVNYPGIAIDDLVLSAIGYDSDLEADGGGWRAEGWIRTDNRLPQRAWLQVAEHTRDRPIIHRILAGGTITRDIVLNAETQYITIAISPFAPMTSERARYTLQVE